MTASPTQDISPEERASILAKLAKLMSTKGTTEAEAASRVAKAQELLARYNLSMDDVEREGGGGGRRADEKLRGGFYEWERSLWGAVAELNFCWYIRWWDYVEVKDVRRSRIWGELRTRDRKVYQHRIIGRVVNIAQTKAMATYLMAVTQRLTLERLHGDNSQMLSRWAISYKDGIAARVVEKLEDRRRQVLSEERDRERAAAKMAMEGHSTATGLTIASLSKSEAEANADFVLGEGYSARKAAQRAQEAMLRRMSEEDYTRWAADNPEEAAARAERERTATRRRSRASGGRAEREKDWGAFRAGYEAGEGVGIDVQAEGSKIAGRLR